MASESRKKIIVSALCNFLSVDPEKFLGDLNSDVKSLYELVLKSVENGEALLNNEFIKWASFAENLPVDSVACLNALNDLNEELITKSVILGNGLKISPVDVIVFSAVHSSVVSLSNSDRDKLPHLMRWIDYVQSIDKIGQLFEKILLELPEFKLPISKVVKKVEAESSIKKSEKGAKETGDAEANLKIKKTADVKKVEGDSKATADKKKVPEKVDEKDKDISVSLLKIQIGLIRKAWKHPSADSLLVEEIDVGEGKCRQVVSGLAKYCTPEQLTNHRVVLITNVKPGKLRDVASEGLVLCASNEDHTVVEPLIAPEAAKIGECVSFAGYDGKPEDVLNPKKKQFEKISQYLSTDEKGVATFKGIPFMTSAGPCTSSLTGASIK